MTNFYKTTFTVNSKFTINNVSPIILKLLINYIMPFKSNSLAWSTSVLTCNDYTFSLFNHKLFNSLDFFSLTRKFITLFFFYITFINKIKGITYKLKFDHSRFYWS